MPKKPDATTHNASADSLTNVLDIIKLSIGAKQNGFKPSQTVAISGSPGIGKSTRIGALSEELGLGFVTISMPQADLAVLSGLPEFATDVGIDLKKYQVQPSTAKGTSWTAPEIIVLANQAAEKSENGVILLLDDLHDTPISSVPFLLQLLLEKRLGNYKLADNVHIVAAMNDSDEAGFEGLPSTVINRMNMLKCKFNPREFINDYATKFPMEIRSFLEQAGTKYLTEAEDTISPFGSPRSWDDFAQEFEYALSIGSDYAGKKAGKLASGHMSEGGAIAFQRHLDIVTKFDLQGYVSKRKLVDVSKMQSLEQILMGYIIHFVKTPEDGAYFLQLLEKNISVGNLFSFSAMEFYRVVQENNEDGLYSQANDGLRWIIASLTERSGEPNPIQDKLFEDIRAKNPTKGAALISKLKGMNAPEEVKDKFWEFIGGAIQSDTQASNSQNNTQGSSQSSSPSP